MENNQTAAQIFEKVLKDRLASGALEKAIEEQVDKLIKSSAESVFRSYGDVGKAI